MLPQDPHHRTRHRINKMNITHVSKILFALSIIALSMPAPIQAKSHLDSLSDSLKQDLYLIKRLANNPHLYNAKYLDCYLGPRASVLTAPFSNSLRSPAPVFRTFWHDRAGHIACYKLEYSQPGANKYLAEFQIVLLQKDDLLIEDIDSILEANAVRAFDEEGRIAQMYSIEPNLDNQNFSKETITHNENVDIGHTKVFVYQDTHVINIARVVVQYAGLPPLPPSSVDMEEATNFMRDNAFEHHRLGHHDQAQMLLQSHIRAHPNDAEAHIKLAESYKAQSCLNQAITEYKTALSRCGDNTDLRDQCIAGLHSLKVEIPPATPSAPVAIPAPISPTIAHPLPRINVPQLNFAPSNSQLKNLEVGF